MKLIRYLLGLSLFLLAGQWVKADETAAESFNPQKSIFEHLGDEYGWNVWNLHIPLPVIVRDEEGAWHVFSSAKLAGGQEYEGFYIAGEGEYEGKVIARNASGHIYRPTLVNEIGAFQIADVILNGWAGDALQFLGQRFDGYDFRRDIAEIQENPLKLHRVPDVVQ